MTICRNHCNGLVFACIAIKTVNFIYTMSPQGRYKHCHRDYYRTNLSTLGFDQVTQNYKLLCFFSRPEEGKAKRAKLLTLGVTNSSWRKVRNWLKPDPCDIYKLRNVFSSMGLFIGPVVVSVAPTSTSARRSLDLPPVFIQNQLIHGMLLRKVLSSRNDEIWIKVNNTKLRFGLSEFAIINGLKCTEVGNKLSANLVDDVEKENIDVGDHIDAVTENHLSDNVIDNIGKETVGVGDRIDTDVADRPITGCTSVALEAPEVLVDVRSIRKNVDDTSVGDKSTVILGDTPVVPRRIRKPAAICESLYVFKFDSGCSNVQGQPTKCIDKRHSRKHIFNIKHPFTISITEPFLDMKLLSSFNKFVDKSLRFNSKCVAEKVVSAYSELKPYLLSFIDFWDKRSDEIAAAVSFDIRMVDRLPTQKNTDCGVFVAAFTEYMIESVQIPASLDHIDSIRADMMYYCGNMERQLL
ncbi:hypothetical protein BC332_11673 [Capsicum chinense]|nr:hypothetical protein BC332_11673 [Capsicum chinense]